MIVQIYEVTTPAEARALGAMGVDHIGVLVGDGSFPREQTIEKAREIFAAIPWDQRHPRCRFLTMSISLCGSPPRFGQTSCISGRHPSTSRQRSCGHSKRSFLKSR